MHALKALFCLFSLILASTLISAHLDPHPPQNTGEGFMGGIRGLPRTPYTSPYTALTSPMISYLNGVVSPIPNYDQIDTCAGSGLGGQGFGEAAFPFPNRGHFSPETNLDPLLPQDYKKLGQAEQFLYRHGHHRLYAGSAGTGFTGNLCYQGAFVNSLEERFPRIDFLLGTETRSDRNEFNPVDETRPGRNHFTSGAMETRNRDGFGAGVEETRNRAGFIPGAMETRNRGGFIFGPEENRNRGGFISGPMEFRNRGGFVTGPMELRSRGGFLPGIEETRNRGGFIPSTMDFARPPHFVSGFESRTPKNHFVFNDP